MEADGFNTLYLQNNNNINNSSTNHFLSPNTNSSKKLNGSKKSSPKTPATVIIINDDLDLMDDVKQENSTFAPIPTSSKKKRKKSNQEIEITKTDFVPSPPKKQKLDEMDKIFLAKDSLSEAERSGTLNKYESPVKAWLEKKPQLNLWDDETPLYINKTKMNGTLYPLSEEPQLKKLKNSAPKEDKNSSGSDLDTPSTSIETVHKDLIPELTKEQLNVVEHVFAGKNVFFSGCAGTGKSTLLRYIISKLPRSTTFVTAPTGIAAINIGGITIHSFAGIGKGDATKVECIHLIESSFRHLNYWKEVKVLIIDEISMVDIELFEKLDFIARVIRKNSGKPFGGIQLVCCGDFFQLPPVSPPDQERRFCFESPLWKETIQVSVELTQVFRQTDKEYIKLLNEIRHGTIASETLKQLESRVIPIEVENDIIPTRLYPHLKDVDEFNELQLHTIEGKGKLYNSKDIGKDEFLDCIRKNCPAPAQLKLKKGAQVLLLKNIYLKGNFKLSVANGSRGVVLDFDATRRGFPIVKFHNGLTTVVEPTKWEIEVSGQVVASREQVPLKLAWAISIHKVQGSTVSRAQISLQNVFEFGQAYVALSRVCSLNGLYLIDFNPKRIRAHPKVVEFYSNSMNFQNQEQYEKNPIKFFSSTSYATNLDLPKSKDTFLSPCSPKQDDSNLGYIAQYSPSDRATCRKCQEKILLHQLRLGQLSTHFSGHTMTFWYHYECFFKQFPKAIRSINDITNFFKLHYCDQEMIAKRIGDPTLKKTFSARKKEDPDVEERLEINSSGQAILRIDASNEGEVDELLSKYLPKTDEQQQQEESEDFTFQLPIQSKNSPSTEKKISKQLDFLENKKNSNFSYPSSTNVNKDNNYVSSNNSNSSNRELEMNAWKKIEVLEAQIETSSIFSHLPRLESPSPSSLPKKVPKFQTFLKIKQ